MADLDLSNYRVAAELGVSDTAVRNWMSGDSRPRDEKLPALAKVLKLKVSELVGA